MTHSKACGSCEECDISPFFYGTWEQRNGLSLDVPLTGFRSKKQHLDIRGMSGSFIDLGVEVEVFANMNDLLSSEGQSWAFPWPGDWLIVVEPRRT